MNADAASPHPFRIQIDRQLQHPQVIALLEEHLAGMRAESPPECVFALDLGALRQPHVTFLTAWQARANPAGAAAGPSPEAEEEAMAEDELMACGAIQELDPTHSELKSMRTAANHLRRGVAQALLTELIAIARQRGCTRVSLETGSTAGFEPALAMYRHFGFVECGPFSDYRENPFSRFMTMEMEQTR